MKTFYMMLVMLVMLVVGVAVGMVAERKRPIPAEEVKFDPDSFSFVRQ